MILSTWVSTANSRLLCPNKPYGFTGQLRHSVGASTEADNGALTHPSYLHHYAENMAYPVWNNWCSVSPPGHNIYVFKTSQTT